MYTAVAENSSLFPRNCMVAHCSLQLQFQGIQHSFLFLISTALMCEYIHTEIHTYTHNNKEELLNIKFQHNSTQLRIIIIILVRAVAEIKRQECEAYTQSALLKNTFFFNLCAFVFCPHACLCEGIRSPRTKVRDRCEFPFGF